MITSLLLLAFILLLYMSGWFLLSLIVKRNDVADVAWGLGFILLAWLSLWYFGAHSTRGIIATGLVTIWGLRLAWHIKCRNQGKAEDYRYMAWRQEWGRWFYLRSYLQVYLLQGMLLFLILTPVLLINLNGNGTFGWLDALGIVVWLTGFYYEVVGDSQLTRFLKNPQNKGMLLRTGLWQYTRHPNYFGEVTLWWGLWLMALSIPYGIYTIMGPLTITILILFVSGVPLLERRLKEHPEFANYEKTTNKFFPGFKK